MPLTKQERERFLAEPHIGSLSVIERVDRGPLSVPTWYDYTPGGQLVTLTAVGSRKGRAIEAAGRFTMLAERVTPSVRYVSVEGPVTAIEPASQERMRAMAERYLSGEALEDYLAFAAQDHPDQLAVWLRPQRWLSADLG